MTRQGTTSVNCGSFILENPKKKKKKKDKLFICRLHQIYVIKAFKGTNYQELSLCKPWHFIRRVQKNKYSKVSCLQCLEISNHEKQNKKNFY